MVLFYTRHVLDKQIFQFMRDYVNPINQIRDKIHMINQRFFNFSGLNLIYSQDLILQDRT